MATETSKHSSSSAIVGDGGHVKTPRKLNFKRLSGGIKIKKLLFFLLAAAVIAIGWELYSNYTGGAVFKINGKSYSQSEVKSLAAYETQNQHIPYKTAARDVYNALRLQVAAQSAGITVSQTELNKWKPDPNGPVYKKYKAWFDILAFNRAVTIKLPKATADGVQGYAYIFWFGDAVQPAFGTPAPTYGNQQAYKAAQQYASQRANYYHDQLQNKTMTSSQVLAAVKKDPKLAPYNYAPANPSMQFGFQTYKSWQTEVSDNAIVNYAKTASSNTLSPVETGKTPTTLGPNPTQFADAYYYIVLVQKTGVPNITQRFKDAQAQLKTKYYGV